MSILIVSPSTGLTATSHLSNPQSCTKLVWVKLAAAPTGLHTFLATHSSAYTAFNLLYASSGGVLDIGTAPSVFNSFGASPTGWTDWICLAITATTAGAGSLIGYWQDNAGGGFVSQSIAGTSFTVSNDDIANNFLSQAMQMAYYMEWNIALTPTQLAAQFLSSIPAVALANLRRYLPLTNAATAGVDLSGNGFAMTAVGTLADGATLPIFPAVSTTRLGAGGGPGISPVARMQFFVRPADTTLIGSASSTATITEGSDSAVGVGAAGGVSGVLASVEGPDAVAGLGGTMAVLSALRSPGPGISPSSHFQFSTLVLDTTVPPVLVGSAILIEGGDAVAAAATITISATAALLEGGDAIAASASTGIVATAAIVEGVDSLITDASAGLDALGSIVEGSDVVIAVAGSQGNAMASMLEGPDSIVALGATGNLVSAALVEAGDIVSGAAAGSTTAVASLVESADITSITGSTLPPAIGQASIVEASDSLSTAASIRSVASAAIVESGDAINAAALPRSSGFALLREGGDSVAAAGSTLVVGRAAIREGADRATGLASTAIAGTGSILEHPDYVAALAAAGIRGSASILELPDATDPEAGGSTTLAVFGYAIIVAVSQSRTQDPQSFYLENSTCLIQASYFSTARAPMQPQFVRYRVDDVQSGLNLVPWTNVTPAASNQVIVTAIQNAMVSLSRDLEEHQVLFQITDWFGDVNYARVVFDLVRVIGDPPVDVAVGQASIVESSDIVLAVE